MSFSPGGGAPERPVLLVSDSSDRWLSRTRQRWKARGAYVAAFVQVSALVGMLVGPSAHRFTCFWVMTVALVLFGLLFVSLRCKVCGEFVMAWAWDSPDWISRLERLRACPQCGATDSSGFPKSERPASAAEGPSPGPTFDRMRQPPRKSWVVSFAVVVGALLLLRLLAGLVQ